MAPRFVNPHLVPLSIEHVSRAALDGALGDDDSGVLSADVNNGWMIMELEILIRGSIDPGLPGAGTEAEVSPDTRKRKRRRVGRDDLGTEVQDMSVPTVSPAFRLVSRKLPPKSLSLVPKPAPVIQVKEPPCEDNEAEAEQRRQQAEAAAVDLSWLLRESQKPYLSYNSEKKVIHVQAEYFLVEDNVMVLELPKPAPKPPSIGHPPRLPPKEHPSPHSLPETGPFCPVIDVTATPSPAISSSSKKRRRSHKLESSQQQPQRTPPAFWRPAWEWGGKSIGYALGYPGSCPIPESLLASGQARYRRDNMRKATRVW